jgi:hypothetical protein
MQMRMKTLMECSVALGRRTERRIEGQGGGLVGLCNSSIAMVGTLLVSMCDRRQINAPMSNFPRLCFHPWAMADSYSPERSEGFAIRLML